MPSARGETIAKILMHFGFGEASPMAEKRGSVDGGRFVDGGGEGSAV